MHPLTEKQIRASFVNASRREAAQAALPVLSDLDWDRLDYLGWRDRKAPLLAYAVVPGTAPDGGPTSVLLRASDPVGRLRRSGVCAWCEDVVHTEDVSLYVARRAGASGRRGNTVGTLLCTGFACSRNVRRRPTLAETGRDDDELRVAIVERRIDGLRERSARFVAEVLRPE